VASDRPLVYTAQSKHFFYCRDAVCEYVFGHGGVPINPFKAFDYFLGDRVARHLVREGNRKLLEACDELWVFGDTLADGVLIEIAQAVLTRKPVKFHTIETRASEIRLIPPTNLDVELEVAHATGLARPDIISHLMRGDTELLVQALGRGQEVRGQAV